MANGKELISHDLLREAEEAAAAELRPVEDLLADALRQCLDDRKWQQLVESGRERANARGLTEDDVPRLVSEARRDRYAR